MAGYCERPATYARATRSPAPICREIAPSGDPADDLVTTVERSAAGDPTAIVGPYGARTPVSVDAHGFLASVRNPASETYQLASSADGLLQSFTPPAGGAHGFQYDALGLLERDDDPLGGFTELARAEAGDAYEVTTETALGVAKASRVEPDVLGGERRVFTDAAGLETLLEEVQGDFSTSLAPDGTQREILYGPDPRLGLATPLVSEHRITLPSSLTSVRTHSRTASVDPNGDLASQQDTTDRNGAVAIVDFDVATLTRTAESPEGRLVFEEIDAQGRLVGAEVDGLEPVALAYDDRGRLAGISQGQGAAERLTSFGYDPDGRLATVTDPQLRTTGFLYDDAGRVVRSDLPGGRSVVYGFDANGNPTPRHPRRRAMRTTPSGT